MTTHDFFRGNFLRCASGWDFPSTGFVRRCHASDLKILFLSVHLKVWLDAGETADRQACRKDRG